MSKPITIKALSLAWAAVKPCGEIWHIDTRGRTKKQFADQFFDYRYETNFKPHGWKFVRVTITPAPAKKGKR
jgi:hypothetical protein